jgi:hypothetical protein
MPHSGPIGRPNMPQKQTPDRHHGRQMRPTYRETYLWDGRRFPCSGRDAIDNGDRVGWLPFGTPHSTQPKVVVETASNGSCHLQTDSYAPDTEKE